MPLLSEAVDEYYAHLVGRGKGGGTAVNRRNTVCQLIQSAGDVQTAKVEARHIDKLLAAHPNWVAGTRNNRIYDLGVFFKWCRYRKYMARDADPCFEFEKQRYVVPPKLRIPVSEWSRLFDACATQLETITIATGLFLFLRGSEQQRIQLKHIHLGSDEIDIFRRKTTDYDTMPIPLELAPYLRNHLTFMAERGYSDGEHFLIYAKSLPSVRKGHQGFVTGTASINPAKGQGRPYQVVQAVLGRAGYPTFREGEHTLRRSAARAYFDSLSEDGYDRAMRRVMAMLGHKSSRSTEVYLGLEHERHTRNRELRGKPMFPALQDAKIVPIRRGV